MELIEGRSEIIIRPNKEFVEYLVQNTVKERRSIFVLPNEIKEVFAHDPDSYEFSFKGIYPNEFKSYEDAESFRQKLEKILNMTPEAIKIKHDDIDDLLFISFFYNTYSAEGYKMYSEQKRLYDFAQLYLSLAGVSIRPTSGDSLLIPDGFTGALHEVPKSELSEQDLIFEGGYKSFDYMIGGENVNRLVRFANDRPLEIIVSSKEKIRLPDSLTKQVTNYIIRYIIEEHRRADSRFYKDICAGNPIELGTKPRKYHRANLTLRYLIRDLESYINPKTQDSIVTDVREFIYRFLYTLQVAPQVQGIGRSQYADAIRKIIEDNSI